MHKLFEYLRPFIRFVVRKALLVLLVTAILSGIGAYYASFLEIETDYSNLIPEHYPSVQALEKVRQTVGGEGSDVAVGIISPDFDASKAFAEALIPKALTFKRAGSDQPYLGSVEFKRETEFLRNNALFFATDEEFDTLEEFLNDQIEQAILEANPFFVDFDDDFDDDEESTSDISDFEDLYNWLVGNEYPIHKDGTSMTLRFFPTGSQTNVRHIDALYRDLELLIQELDPKSFHPEMEIVLAGRLMHRSIQVQAIRNDVAKTFGLGASAVLLLVVLYFMYKSYYARAGGKFNAKVLFTVLLRFPVLALLIAIPLIMSLTWTFGITALYIGNLNLMTSTLALLLFGLGIDFGVHFYGRYSEERASGKSVIDAAEITFTSTGQAITVGAITTASALFVLTIADFRGFSEFGFIAGMGILFAVFAMIVVMPALLAVFERFKLLNLESNSGNVVYGGNTPKRFPGSKAILGLSLAAVVIAIIMIPRISFEYNFDKLEPRYPEFEAKKAIVDGYSSARRGSNPAYIVADTQEDAVLIAETIRHRVATDTTIQTVKSVQTLQDRFPLVESEIQRRLERIEEIRQLLQNQYLETDDSESMIRLRRASQTTAPIQIEQVPDYLRDMFTTRTGEVGTFVMIFPSVGLSDGRKSMAFARDIGTIILDDGRVFHSGSTSIIAAEMLRLMQEESPMMIGLVFLMIVLVMGIYFRSPKWMMLALLPLIVGLLWMMLIIEFLGPKLNFFNLVVLPAMLGIGNDVGVHLTHRYRENGKGSIMQVLRSTGEHCAIGSLTTMIGFFGLMFSFHPGLRSIGELALAGVTTTLLAALLFLPALIQWLEDRESKQNNAE